MQSKPSRIYLIMFCLVVALSSGASVFTPARPHVPKTEAERNQRIQENDVKDLSIKKPETKAR